MISQREARRLKKRVAELEAQERERRAQWATDYPGGVNFWSIGDCGADRMAAVRTARKLGHAIVAVPDMNAATIRLYALPVAKP